MLKGNVLITGGAGFLGRAILQRAEAEEWPANFAIMSRDEQKHALIRKRHPQVRTILGDVRDIDSVRRAMGFTHTVIHAAAMKYIPEGERNVSECLRVNVDGTRNVIRAAVEANVERVLGISTDKAVEPINLYGMTKAVLEKLFFEASVDYKALTAFHLVRYGNVVGSTGSVIPLWQRQFEESKGKGSITITDPNMLRFWMSIEDAVDAILAAFQLSSGECWIPRLGAMRLGDLAECLSPGAPKQITGIRPGEKHNELLLGHQESYWAQRVGVGADTPPEFKGAGFVLNPMTAEPHDEPLGRFSCEEAEPLKSYKIVPMLHPAQGL